MAVPCAHQRTADHVEARCWQPVVVAARLEIRIDEADRQAALAVRQQVHRQESDVVEHVDPAQFGIEFDAVEGGGFVTELQHVRQMQVAVTFAHAPVASARLPQRCKRWLLRAQPRAQRGPVDTNARRWGLGAPGLDRVDEASCDALVGRGRPERAAGRRNCSGTVEVAEFLRHRVDVAWRQGARGELFAPQRAVGEAAHARCDVAHAPHATEARALRALADVHCIEVHNGARRRFRRSSSSQ